MRPRFALPVLAAVAASAALVPAAPAQAPAQASAEASMAAGDLGIVGGVAVRDDGRERARDAVDRSGLRIAGGRATASASRDGGRGRASASATARGVSIFDGLVSAEEVTRTATAQDGEETFAGAVAGLVIDGKAQGVVSGEASWSAGGARITANQGGEGLRVRLTRPVAGFATGTAVVVAAVSADALDGADPAATPEPSPAPAPDPLPIPAPSGDDDGGDASGRPERSKPSDEQRLARGPFVFPVYGKVRCADDWGGARQIGPHQGNDCFAAFGSPVLAVADGTLNRVGTLPISGNRLWLETKDGDSFFYAHLSAFAPDAVSGRTVKAGTLLGFTGNTGDAEPTPPHVHFEIHPGGDDDKAIDPHEILGAWRANGELPSGGWLARYGSDTQERPGALVEVRDFIEEG